MLSIPELIDRKITETFKNTSKVSKTVHSYYESPKKLEKNRRKTLQSNLPITGKSYRFQSENSTSLPQTSNLNTDPFKMHKKIAILNHPLWLESVKLWWRVVCPNMNDLEKVYEESIGKEKYIEVNLKVEKALNKEFVMGDAQKVAENEWEIDAEDWENGGKLFNFDKFAEFLLEISEFFTDGAIENVLLLVNMVFLQITTGVHVKNSVFKRFDEISLVNLRVFQEIPEKTLSSLDFSKWYQRGFGNLHGMKEFLIKKLRKVIPDEHRVKDLWVLCYEDMFPEVLRQSVRGLERFLQRIQGKSPVSLPISEKKKEKVPRKCEVLQSSQKKERRTTSNFNKTQEVPKGNGKKLSVFGKRCGKTQEIASDFVKPGESPVVSMFNGKFSIQLLDTAISTSRPRSVPLETIEKFENLASSRSEIQLIPTTLLFSKETPDSEYTPKLKFSKKDIIYHKLNKNWRTGVFKKEKILTENMKKSEKSPKKSRNSCDKSADMKNSTRYRSGNNSCEDYYQSYLDKAVEPKKNVDSESLDEKNQLIGLKIQISQREKQSFQLPKLEKPLKTTEMQAKTGFSRMGHKKIETFYSLEGNSLLLDKKTPGKLVFHNEIDYLQALNQTRYDFNCFNQSVYLKNYKSVKNDYRSRRDELGGTINPAEWNDFICRLEATIKITENRRKKIRNRRKKTIKGPYGQKKRLWQSIFIRPEDQETMKTRVYLQELQKMNETCIVLENPFPKSQKASPDKSKMLPNRYRLSSAL